MKDETRSFWAVRAQKYDQLEWVKRPGYLRRILSVGRFSKDDSVLEVGTGTGKVAHAIAPFVRKVVGIDVSEDMLKQAYLEARANEVFLPGNIYGLDIPDNTFNQVVARMVFHHLIEDPIGAMQECYRVLRPNGMMILAEGVPPHISLKSWYSEMFSLKEKRLTFMEQDLIALFREAGFREITVHVHVSRQVSIKNWLRGSGLPKRTQDAIYQMHLYLDESQRRHYNATELEDDMLMDFKNVIVTGLKLNEDGLD